MLANQAMTTDELMVRITFIDQNYKGSMYWMRRRQEVVAEMKTRSVCVICE